MELARTEEAVKHETVTAFSLSDAAEAGAEAFTPLAEAAGKALIPEITPGVEVEGVQDDLFRLLSILLDNGVKYCDPGGTIVLSLSRRGRSACLLVSNPCEDLDPRQLPRYFDRFYRRTPPGPGAPAATASGCPQQRPSWPGTAAGSPSGTRAVSSTFLVTLPLAAKR